MDLLDFVSAGRLKEMKEGAGVLQDWLGSVFYLPLLENREAFVIQKEKIAAALVDMKMGKLARKIRLLPSDESILHGNNILVQQWSYLNFVANFWGKFEELSDNLKINLVYQSGVNFTKKKLENCTRLHGQFIPVFQNFSTAERLLEREIWVIDANSGKWYLLLDYSFNNRPFEKNYNTGMIYEGTIIPFPFKGSQRCLDIDLRRIDKKISLLGLSSNLNDINEKIYSAILENPFLERFPIILEIRSEFRDDKWYLYDINGKCIPSFSVDNYFKFITVASACFYSPKVVCGIWSPGGFNPFCIIKDNRIISLVFEQEKED